MAITLDQCELLDWNIITIIDYIANNKKILFSNNYNVIFDRYSTVPRMCRESIMNAAKYITRQSAMLPAHTCT